MAYQLIDQACVNLPIQCELTWNSIEIPYLPQLFAKIVVKDGIFYHLTFDLYWWMSSWCVVVYVVNKVDFKVYFVTNKGIHNARFVSFMTRQLNISDSQCRCLYWNLNSGSWDGSTFNWQVTNKVIRSSWIQFLFTYHMQ